MNLQNINKYILEFGKILLLVLIVIIISYIVPNNKSIITIYKNNKTIDSLQIVIDRLQIENYKLDCKLDSQINNKKTIINKYETNIQNYSNPSIISSDSISKYISNKLQNWK